MIYEANIAAIRKSLQHNHDAQHLLVFFFGCTQTTDAGFKTLDARHVPG